MEVTTTRRRKETVTTRRRGRENGRRRKRSIGMRMGKNRMSAKRQTSNRQTYSMTLARCMKRSVVLLTVDILCLQRFASVCYCRS